MKIFLFFFTDYNLVEKVVSFGLYDVMVVIVFFRPIVNWHSWTNVKLFMLFTLFLTNIVTLIATLESKPNHEKLAEYCGKRK